MRTNVSVLDLFGFFLSITGYLFYFIGSDENFHNADANSAMQSIK